MTTNNTNNDAARDAGQYTPEQIKAMREADEFQARWEKDPTTPIPAGWVTRHEAHDEASMEGLGDE